jgi:hypothetical protein
VDLLFIPSALFDIALRGNIPTTYSKAITETQIFSDVNFQKNIDEVIN